MKHREWKVHYTMIEDYDGYLIDGLFGIEEGEGHDGKYPDGFKSIHVIEYAAYEELEAENARLTEALEELEAEKARILSDLEDQGTY